MDRRTLTLVLAAVMLLAGSQSFAQESHPIGVVMGYPGSFGIVWHTSDGVAIRPVVTVSRASTKNSSTAPVAQTSSNSSWALGGDFSMLFFLHKFDALRTYVSPRVSYTYSKSSISGGPNSQKSTGIGLSGSFGAQYWMSDKFALYGEVGVFYGYSKSTSTTALGLQSQPTFTNESRGHTFGPRTGIGAAYYF